MDEMVFQCYIIKMVYFYKISGTIDLGCNCYLSKRGDKTWIQILHR